MHLFGATGEAGRNYIRKHWTSPKIKSHFGHKNANICMRQSVAVATVFVRPRVFLCVCALLPLSSGTGAALMKGKPLPSWCALTSGAEKVILCAH